ncbi:condensation domain-containing protein [Streptomyces anulatus]
MSHDNDALTPDQEKLLGIWLAEEIPGAHADARQYTPPRHRAEAVLADIWAEALNVSTVGVTDDYFALGGDSVLAIVIVARAGEVGLDIAVRDLFEARTIARLFLNEDQLREIPPTREPAPTAPEPVGDRPLTPLQEGILYHSLASGPHRDGYLVQAHCLVTGHVDLPLLRRAWEVVLAEQPALRTAFRLSGPDGPRAWTAPAAALPWTEDDWSDRDAPTALAEHLGRDRTAGFDLEHPPLSRVAVFREGEDRHRMVWTHHHLVLDGWSQQIVLRRVLDHYAGLVVDGPVDPVTPPVVAAAEPETPTASEEEAHWRGLLAGARPTLLVRGRNIPEQPENRGRAVATDVWPADLGTALETFAAAAGVTAATVVTACWGAVAAARTGSDEALFGLTVSGRDPAVPGAAEAVGMFVNTLVTRVTTEGATAGEWLRELQRRLTESRRFSGTALSGALRRSGHDRLFDSLLVVENFPTWLSSGSRVAGLVVEDVEVILDEGYPLVVEVATHETLAVRLRYDLAQVAAARAREILGDLRACAGQLVTGAAPTPAALRTVMTDRLAAARDRTADARRAKAEDLLGAARRRPVGDDVPGSGA